MSSVWTSSQFCVELQQKQISYHPQTDHCSYPCLTSTPRNICMHRQTARVKSCLHEFRKWHPRLDPEHDPCPGLLHQFPWTVPFFLSWILLIIGFIDPTSVFFPHWDMHGKVTALRMYTSKWWKQKLIDFVDSDSDHFEQPAIDKPSPRGGIRGPTKKAGDRRVHQRQTFHNSKKQARALTVMPIDRSALHAVRETSRAIGFVRRRTCCNCKELQTAKRTTWVKTVSLLWCVAQNKTKKKLRSRREGEENKSMEQESEEGSWSSVGDWCKQCH